MYVKVKHVALVFFVLGSCAASPSLRGRELDVHQPVIHVLDFLESECTETEVTELIDQNGGSIMFIHGGQGLAVIEGLTEDAMVNEVKASPCVTSIEADESFILDDEVYEPKAPDANPQSPSSPADAYFYKLGFQWNMDIIRANEAWAAGKVGSEAVTVAILDSGVDPFYFDLQGRVDPTTSTSFIWWENPSPLPIYTDLHYHGTYVASIVASNAYAIAGVTSKTNLMAVKVCSTYGGCPYGSIISGILHAVDNGAHVINMSLGGGFGKPGNGSFVGYLNRIFNYANRKGVTIVVSAGNDGMDLDHNGSFFNTFCDMPNTICVSATDANDASSSFTNYGNSAIDVAAPGSGVWGACSTTSEIFTQCGNGGVWILPMSGTSMAAPHVAGLAALVIAEGAKNPGQVKTIIGRGADDLGKKGNDPYFGKGRINVANTILG